MSYRVIQWATGNIGQRALAASIRHPDLEVVGLRVYGADKVGVDAGTIAGSDTVTGVLATDDVDALVALDADCVLYMPSRLDLDELCRLLASGKNVVSTCSELLRARRALPAEQVERLERPACRATCRCSPPAAARASSARSCRSRCCSSNDRVDRIVIEEFANMSQRAVTPALVRGDGVRTRARGRSTNGAPTTCASTSDRRSRRSPSASASRSTGSRRATEVAATTRAVTIAAGEIGEGSVAAQRTIVAAMDGDPERLVFQATWYCSTELDHDWDLGETGWRVTVEGDAPLKVDIAFPVDDGRLALGDPGPHRASRGQRRGRGVRGRPRACSPAPTSA